jgi:hypothetical protein
MWTYEPTSPCGRLWRVLLQEAQVGVVSGYSVSFVDRQLNIFVLNLGSGIIHMPEDSSYVDLVCPE